jgi:phenylalanyl-tRNA synthetase beta chain
MKISTQWLADWVTSPLAHDELAHRLTMAGLEVDTIEPVAPRLDGVIVARVLEADTHPNADRLSLCRIDTGNGEATVVCGAKNVRADLTVAYAAPGAVLPDGRRIENAVIRDVASAGMLCSAVELGLGEDAGGLIELPAEAPIGASLREFLQLDDHVIDIELTPNRGDCLSLIGVAREVAALTGAPMRPVVVDAVPAQRDDVFPVTLDVPRGCPRYAGRIIRGVDAARPTPIWMVERLRRAGIRSISAVVDVTNYVMLELGQPMHGFDLDRLEGGIVVRNGRDAERLELLDGQTIDLDAETLVIADAKQAVALAGVMGGAGTGVESHTRNVFLESAYFDPITLAGVARRYRLHTDASHRFERGVDFTGQERAVERASDLIVQICGGEPGPTTVAEAPAALPARSAIPFRHAAIERLLGITLPPERVRGSLEALNCVVTSAGDDLSVTPPPFRFDLELEADLLEELARIVGYDNIPATLPTTTMRLPAASVRRDRDAAIRAQLIAQGYYEAITYSFINEQDCLAVAPDKRPHRLENPITSDMSVMRTSIWPGLLKAAAYNLNRQAEDVRFFELGLVFEHTEKGLEQRHVLGGIALGKVRPEQWGAAAEKVDYYDIKQDVENIIARLGQAVPEWRSDNDPALHPGQSALLTLDGAVAGRVGVLHPSLARHFDLAPRAVLFELELECLPADKVPAFEPISKFPSVRRDLSVVVDRDVMAGAIVDAAREAAGDSLKHLQLFDEYRGQGIDSDKKSLTIGLIFQARSSTLRDEEIEATMERVMATLRAGFGGTLRD